MISNIQTETIDQLINFDQAIIITGISKSTLERKINAGTFPKKVKVSHRTVRFRLSEINEWMSDPLSYSNVA